MGVRMQSGVPTKVTIEPNEQMKNSSSRSTDMHTTPQQHPEASFFGGSDDGIIREVRTGGLTLLFSVVGERALLATRLWMFPSNSSNAASMFVASNADVSMNKSLLATAKLTLPRALTLV